MPEIKLTKFENQTFKAQTVHLAGKAFINCKFEQCTVVLTNTPSALDRVNFDGCNWRLEYDVLWSDPGARVFLRALLDLLDKADPGQVTLDASKSMH